MPAGHKVGEPVPEVALPDIEGQFVELEDFSGEVVMVLFWNGLSRHGVVQQGAGLTSTMVLDQQFTAGRFFEAIGTPSAVLVDAEGRIASEVAVGAPAVPGLAGASRAES